MHFFPFNPVDKRTALTFIDADGNWHRASKGAPEQVTCKLDVYILISSLFRASLTKVI